MFDFSGLIDLKIMLLSPSSAVDLALDSGGSILIKGGAQFRNFPIRSQESIQNV